MALLLERSAVGGQFRQGEIFRDFWEYTAKTPPLELESTETPPIHAQHHTFAVAMTPDCDLEQDFKARYPGKFEFRDEDQKEKFTQNNDHYLIPHLLLCFAGEASEVRTSAGLTSGLWNRVKSNQLERFHHLGPGRLSDAIEGAPDFELFLDFKRVIGIPLAEFYGIREDEERRLALIPPPYLQHLLNRFYCYQSRVALPDN